MNLASECIAAHLPKYANNLALIVTAGHSEQCWTYAELDQAVRAFASQLSKLLPLKDVQGQPARIIIGLPSGPEYIFAFFGSIAAGFVPVPASPQLTAAELQQLIDDSAASLLFGSCLCERPPATVIEESELSNWRIGGIDFVYRDCDADSPAYMLYTSGTTGTPKGVLHAHRSIHGRAPIRGDSWLGLCHKDRLLHAGTVNWSYTLGVGLMDPWAAGATAVIYNGEPDPLIWPELIERYQCTLFATVPSVYRRLLKYSLIKNDTGERYQSLRHAVCAGEPLTAELSQQWQAHSQRPLYEALGMSECSTYISNGPAVPPKAGCSGKPQQGRRVTILDAEAFKRGQCIELGANQQGLLAVYRSDPGIMLGYWQRPEETRQVFVGDWFVGGDLASMDNDGYVLFHGRDNDTMNVFGYRVSPLEVENTLMASGLVSEVAVAEVQQQGAALDVSSLMVAFVVEKPNVSAIEELKSYSKANLANYKQPQHWQHVEQLPRSRTGKLLRRELSRLFPKT